MALLAAVALVTSIPSLALSDDGNPKADLVDSVADPAATLPDGEREAVYAKQLESHTLARDAWVTNFEDTARSVVGMRTAELHVASAGPEATLADAIAAADVVVSAVVTDLTFTPRTTIATLRVDDVVKGSARDGLRIAVGGGPEPDPSYTTGVLAVDPAMPFLYEGTRAVLLLEAEPADSPMPVGYYVQPFTGTYLVEAGTIRAHEGNPFAGSVDGLAVQELTDLMRATLD